MFSIKPFYLLLATYFVVLPALAPAAAQTGFYVGAGEEKGQGVVRNNRGECYLVTPLHVIGNIPLVMTEIIGPNGKRYRAGQKTMNKFPADDLVILPLAEAPDFPCEDWVTPSPFEPLLDKQKIEGAKGECYLRMVESTGDYSRLPVRLLDYDSKNILFETTSNQPLLAGMSGAPLYAGSSMIGLLNKLDGSERGSAKRIDYVQRQTQSFFGENVGAFPILIARAFELYPVRYEPYYRLGVSTERTRNMELLRNVFKLRSGLFTQDLSNITDMRFVKCRLKTSDHTLDLFWPKDIDPPRLLTPEGGSGRFAAATKNQLLFETGDRLIKGMFSSFSLPGLTATEQQMKLNASQEMALLVRTATQYGFKPDGRLSDGLNRTHPTADFTTYLADKGTTYYYSLTVDGRGEFWSLAVLIGKPGTFAVLRLIGQELNADSKKNALWQQLMAAVQLIRFSDAL